MKHIIQSGSLSGNIKVPTSKSYAQRAVLAALLAPGVSKLYGFEWSDDSLHTVHAAISLGAEVRVVGTSLEVTGSRTPRADRIFAGESGLTSRLLSAILMTYNREMELTGSGSLLTRSFEPMLPIYEQLKVHDKSNVGRLPLQIRGPISDNEVRIDGSLTSQFVSGLLMALPATNFDQKVMVDRLQSRPYVDMTLDLLEDFGVKWQEESPDIFQLTEERTYQSTEYTIEGDWSGGAFLITAGLLAGDISISGLKLKSQQADRAILRLVKSWVDAQDENLLKVRKQTSIPGFLFDANHCPDLIPPLVALATIAEEHSHILGVQRLKHKESDRALVLKEEFGTLGIRIDIAGNEMIIQPGTPTGGVVKSHNDHRIAMALAVAALRAKGPVEIRGSEAVSKSYPNFWKDLIGLGAHIEKKE